MLVGELPTERATSNCETTWSNPIITSVMIDTNQQFKVAALYRFVGLDDYAALRDPLLSQMRINDIKGTLLLAREGINGTIAGSAKAVDDLLDWMQRDPMWRGRLQGIDVKESFSASMPFARCKVKLKNEIVTMGITDVDPNKSVGTYVAPRDWNDLISDPEVLTIDTRNDYEVKIGTFKGAINPKTATFREFPDYARRKLDPGRHKKVAMFCTGGIRCEKSTAYMKSLGFEEVYHLQGGILKYLEEIPKEESLWEGECFVFDERVAVDHDLNPGRYTQCHACRMPLSDADLTSDRYVPGESCPYCFDSTTPEQRARYRERERQVRLAEKRGDVHIGGDVASTQKLRQNQKMRRKQAQRTGN